jgi:hypothetical protein
MTYNKKIENTQILKHNIYYRGAVSEKSTNFCYVVYEYKTTASMKNPQIQLNRNSLLIFGTHTTFRDYNILQSNIPYIRIFNFH